MGKDPSGVGIGREDQKFRSGYGLFETSSVAMSSRVAYSSLEFRSEVWSGDINGKVTGI